jgi:hypothetical protein
MAYTFTGQALGMQPIATVSTTQNHPLGTRARAVDADYGEGEFVYMKGGTNITTGSWATLKYDDGSTTALAADARGPVGIAMSALDASTDFGWFQIYGKANGSCLTSFADDGRVFCTASVGYVDDTSVTGDLVNGAMGASTSTARNADFELNFPWTDDASSTLA